MVVPVLSRNETSDHGQDIFVSSSETEPEVRGSIGQLDEFSSAESSLSDFTAFEMPEDVPDGPEFYDLAHHVEQVTKQLTTKPVFMPNHSLSEDQLKTDVDHANGSMNLTENLELTTTSYITCDSQAVHKETTSMEVASNASSPLTRRASLASPSKIKTDEPFTLFNDSYSSNDLSSWVKPILSETTACGHLSNHDESIVDDAMVGPRYQGLDDPQTALTLDDDFGDFECSAEVVNPSTAEYSDTNALQNAESQSNGFLERLLSHLETVLDRAFKTVDGDPTHTEQLTQSVTYNSAQEDTDSSERTISIGRSSEQSIWSQLLPAMRPLNHKYKWDKSAIYDAYLRSIHVDRSCAPPVFAAQLRLLQPVNSLSQDCQPEVKDRTSVTITSQADLTPSENQTSHISPSTPRKVSDTIASQLDLDFLEHRSSGKPSGKLRPVTLSALELELLSRIPDPPPPSTTSVQNSVISSMLAEQSSRKSVKLGDNVRAALSRLPKLTFMRSRHLIFPVSNVKPS